MNIDKIIDDAFSEYSVKKDGNSIQITINITDTSDPLIQEYFAAASARLGKDRSVGKLSYYSTNMTEEEAIEYSKNRFKKQLLRNRED